MYKVVNCTNYISVTLLFRKEPTNGPNESPVERSVPMQTNTTLLLLILVGITSSNVSDKWKQVTGEIIGTAPEK